ncbi:glycoside hydrolase family 3 C-terminal domain-containing protein [Devosia rhodophyticola]|uniref:Glycoside hydrolase family 3 C-terminal domain-containing protein n=1 Tax=Devosia rhodophyticola TaxID=3026423 RepID=A0ABY7YXF8_9HYPH|nr:glycoside hydrolase family 3 C-terminal domain-containing protein [Devosia rhodophyticola]WDR06063.1 glycoside hydrolase family 3 C-terminal domain-containing protein [Devosia rhodophyticola]
MLALKFEAGLFENPYLNLEDALSPVHAERDAILARKAAEKALILLKNDGILPLSVSAPLKVAVIGPNADEALLGGYSGDSNEKIGILEGLKRLAPSSFVIEHAVGVWITPPDELGRHRSFSQTEPALRDENLARIEQAIELATRSDIIVLCVGDVPAVTREAVAPELPGDRSTLGLWGDQDLLIDALAATGKPLVIVLLNGRPLVINKMTETANAIVEGWYLGEATGLAVADVLLGNTNPGGKLPVSIPASVGELPVYYNRHPSADVNQYLEGARRALFPFGHGLSYTSFEISSPRLSSSSARSDETVQVVVDVTNTGPVAGDEVVQLYVRDDFSSLPRPVIELRGFERIHLHPSQTKTVEFSLGAAELGFWNVNLDWVVEPGSFTISVGRSSQDHKSTTLTVV